MDERDLEPEQPPTRHLVDQLRARRHQLMERAVHIIGLERDVMHARTSSCKEPSHMRVIAHGRDELYAAVADEKRCGVDSLLAQ